MVLASLCRVTMIKHFIGILSCLLIIGAVSDAVIPIQITAYPGTPYQTEFTMKTKELPWREAVNGCRQDKRFVTGMWLQVLSYIKAVAVNTEGWIYDGFWIDYVRYAGEVEYRRPNSCESGFNQERRRKVNGYISNIRQCLYVNTSSPNTDDDNVYAGPCESKMPFICHVSGQHYSDQHQFLPSVDPDSTIINADTKFTTDDDASSVTTANLTECIDKFFLEFSNYAAEFNNSTRTCRIKKAAIVTYLPIVVQVEFSTDGEIVVHKNSKPVEFNSKVKNVQPIDWPCQRESTTDNLPPQITTSLASEINALANSLSVNSLTSYDWITNDTCCACLSTINHETLDPLTLLDKRSLSRFKMKKISALDSRVSATTIGCFGAVILVTVCSLMIFADIHSFVTKTRRQQKEKCS